MPEPTGVPESALYEGDKTKILRSWFLSNADFVLLYLEQHLDYVEIVRDDGSVVCVLSYPKA